jgi:hypothetical protein
VKREFTNGQLAAEAEREIGMRRVVWARKGHLTPTETRRIEIMQEIADYFRSMPDPVVEPDQPDLFDE